MLQKQFESQTLNINSCPTHQPKKYQSLDVNISNKISISQHEHEHEHEQNSTTNPNKTNKIKPQQKQPSPHSPHSLHSPPSSHPHSPKKQKINQHYYIPKQIQIPTLYPKRILETIYRNGKGSRKNIFEKEISYRGSEGDASLEKIGKQGKYQYGADRNQSFNQYNSNSRDMRRNNNSCKNSKQLLPINPQSNNSNGINNFARTSIDYYTFQRSLSKYPQNPHQTSSIVPPPIKSNQNPTPNLNPNSNINTNTNITNNNNKNIKSSLSQRPSSNYIPTGQGKKMAVLTGKVGAGIGNGNVNNGSSPRNKYRELYQQYSSNNNNVKGNLNQQKFRKTFSISRPAPSTGGQQSRIMQQIMQVYQTNPHPHPSPNPAVTQNTITNKNRNNSSSTPKNESKIKQTPQTPKSTTKYYRQTYTATLINASQLPRQTNPQKTGFTFTNRNSKSNLSHYQPSHPLISAFQGNQPPSTPYNPVHSPKYSKTSTNFHTNNNTNTNTNTGNANANVHGSSSGTAIRPSTSSRNGTANTNTNGNGNIKQFNHNQAQDHSNYLAKYEIIKELGKGNYGIVYLARKKQAKDKSIKIQKESQLQKQKQLDQQFLFAYGSKNQQIQRQSTVLPQLPSHLQSQNLQSPKSPRSPCSPCSPSSASPSQPSLLAIKIYQKFKMSVSDPTKFKNIRKQINIMQNISHPNIIQLYQSVQTLTKINIVVEYGGALSLLEYLRQNYPLSEARQRDIGRQVIRGLGYLHGRNIVHRDVKLQNLLVRTAKGYNGQQENQGKQRNQGEDGITVKLIDFGFSTLSNFLVILAYKNRKLNAICGTPNYMAPQILAKKQYIGQFADVWSYGVVMYTIGQGRHPFKAQSLNQLERIVNKGVFQFKHITNPIQQNFIKRILKLKPQERPTAKDILQHPWLALDQIEVQKSSIN